MCFAVVWVGVWVGVCLLLLRNLILASVLTSASTPAHETERKRGLCTSSAHIQAALSAINGMSGVRRSFPRAPHACTQNQNSVYACVCVHLRVSAFVRAQGCAVVGNDHAARR